MRVPLKRLGFLVLAAGLASGSATDAAGQAGGTPGPVAASPRDWTGPYLGLRGGWGRVHMDLAEPAGGADAVVPSETGRSGAAYLGWRVHRRSAVAGVEVGFGWTDLRGGWGQSPWYKLHAEVGRTASVRASLGATVGRAHLYGTGGLAHARLRVAEWSCACFDGDCPEAHSVQPRLGLTAGAGLDWALTRALSVGILYRHFDLGRVNGEFRDSATDLSSRVVDSGITLRLPASPRR
jgi:outer membrane immunogenic protein